MAEFQLIECLIESVDYVVVYVTEAHPTDGWLSQVAPYKDIKYASTTEERLEVANMFAAAANIKAKVFVDSIGDELEHSYEARPERLYVLRGGTILWRCGPGPFEYDLPGLKTYLNSAVS